MIERPDRRQHSRQFVDEPVIVSGSDRTGLVVVAGTIVDSSPGGLRITLASTAGIDPTFVSDVIISRKVGAVRQLVVRALAVEGRTIRAAFVDPDTVDPSEWQT